MSCAALIDVPDSFRIAVYMAEHTYVLRSQTDRGRNKCRQKSRVKTKEVMNYLNL